MAKTMDAYLRVSRVGDRDKTSEAYRSPAIQRGEIERWCDREGVTLGKVSLDEDVSGGKAVSERKLEGLIQRAERGDSDGIITCWLDRFGRDHVENLLAVRRLKNAGARLVCVNDGVDSDQESGKLVINLKSIEAENYLERTTANWRLATGRAVAEGKHIACKAPYGYLRADFVNPEYDGRGHLIPNARLVPDPELAPAVTEAFEKRTRGESYPKIIEALPRRIAKSTLAHVFQNRAYLGEARGPNGDVKVDAHEPLTTPDTFSRCRAGKAPRRTGLSQGALLGGLITCASCGHKLAVKGTTVKGERVPIYACPRYYASGVCTAPGAAYVDRVDAYVVQELADTWGERAASIASAESAWLEAREAVRAATDALDETINDTSLPPKVFKQRVDVLHKDLEEKQHALWSLDEPDIDLDKPVVVIDGKPTIYEVWGESVEADRLTLRRAIATITLAKTRAAIPGSPGWQPVEERVSITWR